VPLSLIVVPIARVLIWQNLRARSGARLQAGAGWFRVRGLLEPFDLRGLALLSSRVMINAPLTSLPAPRVTLVLMALFSGFGMALPFLAPWMAHARGLSGVEIGAILASAQLMRIAVGPGLAAWADGFADRRTPVLIFSFAALVGFSVFFLMHGFWAMFVVYFLAASASAAIMPLMESMALRAGRSGPMPYGVIRGVGSTAFIAANVVGGLVVASYGLGIAPWWIVAGYAAAVVTTLLLLPDPAPVLTEPMGVRERLGKGLSLMRGKRFFYVVVGAGLIQCSHGFYYAFGSVVWDQQGVPAGLIGFLWAIGVAAEVTFLFFLVRIEKRVAPETLLLLGAAAGVLRWTALALAPPIWALWPLQLLHAATFAAAHVGALRIIHREAPEAVTGVAQTIYAALASGLFLGLSTLGAGVLYDLVGGMGYGVMALLAAGGGFLIYLASKEARIGAGTARIM
jgi:PPP family 3-phenylpropionic acid transporter